MEIGSTVFYKNADGKIAYVEGGEKACRSAWVDKEEGRCSDGVQSRRKGERCNPLSVQEEMDAREKGREIEEMLCNTSRSELEAACLTGYNGTALCDIDGGDDEWLEAREAFAEYMAASKVCHNAARWSECGAPEEYKKWRCAEIKALHYVKLKDTGQLPKGMYSSFPDLREYAEFCKGSLIAVSWTIVLILLIFIF